jgi:hypothetical protein
MTHLGHLRCCVRKPYIRRIKKEQGNVESTS